MSQVPIQENTGDFRLLDRRCIEAIKSYGKLSVIQKEGLAGLIITRGKSLFFILFIIGYAMIHLLIEIQTRYRFVMVPSLVILQSYGVYVLHQISVSLRKNG